MPQACFGECDCTPVEYVRIDRTYGTPPAPLGLSGTVALPTLTVLGGRFVKPGASVAARAPGEPTATNRLSAVSSAESTNAKATVAPRPEIPIRPVHRPLGFSIPGRQPWSTGRRILNSEGSRHLGLEGRPSPQNGGWPGPG